MNKQILIIAEAGVNHNGKIILAKELIDAAYEAKADYVKFQIFKTEASLTKNTKKASYQIKNTGDNNESQFEMVKRLELSQEEFLLLFEYCNSKGIKFLATGFDSESLIFLKSLGLKLAKIPSGEITNLPYLRAVANLFPEIILSTGMANIDEIKTAFMVLLANGTKQENITILHCNTEYPTPMEDVNLKAMLDIQKQLNTNIGYSDHTLGIEVPLAAVALGAKVIEKHFTLDRDLPGPDHKASLEPEELKAMVSAIRNVEKAISGSGIKEESPSEKKNKPIARKSIIASHNIKKNEIFTEENLSIKRPGTGINPMRWDEIIGLRAIKDFQEDDLIELI